MLPGARLAGRGSRKLALGAHTPVAVAAATLAAAALFNPVGPRVQQAVDRGG